MTWTVNANLPNRLAGTGSMQAAMTGGVLKIYSAADLLLSQHSVGTVTTLANVVTVPINVSTVEAGVVNQTATKATLEAAGAALLLSTDNVGLVGSDIPLDDNTNWNAGSTVAPGQIVLTLGVVVT